MSDLSSIPDVYIWMHYVELFHFVELYSFLL